MSISRSKIDKNGKYKKFYGYTVVSFLDSDKYSFVEKYIRNSNILSKYFSALPAHTYHMTVFNLWCCKSPLLPIHHKWISEYKNKLLKFKKDTDPSEISIPGEVDEEFAYENYFYPMMLKISELSKPMSKFSARIKLSKSLNYITAEVNNIDQDNLIKLRELRSNISPLITHDDKNLVPHITFAYKYREIEKNDVENVQKELLNLQNLIKSKDTLVLKPPEPCMFSSMEHYITLDDMRIE